MPKRGQFSKSPRVTVTESFILEEQRRPKPSPNDYFKDPPKKKKINFFIGKEDKTSPVFLEAQAQALSSPGSKYNPTFKGVDANQRSFSIVKTKHSRMDKVVKDPSKPGPGDYDSVGAFNKTQTVIKAT